MTAEYELGEGNGERRIREYKQGKKIGNSLETNKREHRRKKEEATRIREYELEEKREREDRRRKEEATRRLYEVAQVEEEVKEKRKKKIIGTRFFDPKERRVVDTRRTYLEREEEDEPLIEDYFEEEVEQPKTAAPRPRQRRKQRPKPTEKIYYEEEKIGPFSRYRFLSSYHN